MTMMISQRRGLNSLTYSNIDSLTGGEMLASMRVSRPVSRDTRGASRACKKRWYCQRHQTGTCSHLRNNLSLSLSISLSLVLFQWSQMRRAHSLTTFSKLFSLRLKEDSTWKKIIKKNEKETSLTWFNLDREKGGSCALTVLVSPYIYSIFLPL